MFKAHYCHCGFKAHVAALRAKKLGFLGIIFFCLHFLFHVVECLVLPAVLVGLGGHFSETPAVAIESGQVVLTEPQEAMLEPSSVKLLRLDLSDTLLWNFNT